MILDKIITQYEKEKPAQKMLVTLIIAAIILLGVYSNAQHRALNNTIVRLESTEQQLSDIQGELEDNRNTKPTEERPTTDEI